MARAEYRSLLPCRLDAACPNCSTSLHYMLSASHAVALLLRLGVASWDRPLGSAHLCVASIYPKGTDHAMNSCFAHSRANNPRVIEGNEGIKTVGCSLCTRIAVIIGARTAELLIVPPLLTRIDQTKHDAKKILLHAVELISICG